MAATSTPLSAEQECRRLKGLRIPPNNEAICWWLSVNLALFHKRRPEFDTLLKGGGDYISDFSRLYDYYSNGVDESDNDLTTEIRKNLATTDNKAAVPQNKTKERKFSINSTKSESVSEYFYYLTDSITKTFKSDPAKKNLLDALLIPMINANPDSFEQTYDVYYHALYFGLRRQVNDKNPIDMKTPGLSAFYEFPPVKLSSRSSTVVLSFERKLMDKYSNYIVTPLETITLPTLTEDPIELPEDILKDVSEKDKESIEQKVTEVWSNWVNLTRENTKATEFYLDAMTVSTPGGGHFVTYIKCGDSWLYDNGMSGGNLGEKDGHKEFNSFEEMMNDENGKMIRENLVLLYYSKVEGEGEATIATAP